MNGPAGSKGVLFVDDEQSLVILATRLLTRAGYDVTGFSNPQEALKDFQSRPNDFRVVITDVSMPGCSGPALLAEMRKLRPDLPGIITSGCITPADVEAAARLGNATAVTKPSTMEAFVKLLAPLLDGRASNQGPTDL
ncbi:MAG TPA: response regulator [Polyangiaceae bacterium]|jgi:DNA-binding NtrC family response regulator|nr:response regulator [Polyangiaceae bacterium]